MKNTQPAAVPKESVRINKSESVIFHMKTKLLPAVSSFAIAFANAQSFQPTVVGSSGTFATSASASMSWTIGEVMTETYSSAGFFFTQGFHQPDTAFVTVVSNPVSQNISIYPNPVVDNLVINFSGASGFYSLEIFDALGNALRKENVPASAQKQLTVSFREFANGIYFLNIINSESTTRTSYKINKAE